MSQAATFTTPHILINYARFRETIDLIATTEIGRKAAAWRSSRFGAGGGHAGCGVRGVMADAAVGSIDVLTASSPPLASEAHSSGEFSIPAAWCNCRQCAIAALQWIRIPTTSVSKGETQSGPGTGMCERSVEKSRTCRQSARATRR